MHKVMTRAQHQSSSRPPARRDSRRPGGAPPRTPGGTPARTAPGGGRPPRSRGSGVPAVTKPADNRPSTVAAAPARSAAATVADRRTSPPPPSQALRTLVPQPRPTDVFADLLVAVLSGQRPVHSMLRHTVGRAYDELAWLAERGPLRTHGARPVVRDIGYCVPRPGAVEAFARIGAGDQLRAMAFRLERGHDLRWRCTAVELGGARPPRATDE
ncbi:Rv3235 family protein [Streptomyces sp. NPDC001663]|uniref:Rv3235 family protein n=1 Tax=Streptomyces sp. NPDC001663 TaxID=3364597 RepID=UPI0036952B9C